MLDPFSRGAIVALSALCVVGILALAPVGVRSSIEDVHVQPPPLAVTAADRTGPVVAIQRDPFTEPIASVAPASAEVARASGGQGALGPLPSNLSSDTIPAVPGTSPNSSDAAPRVSAIVTGAHPYAMLETGGMHLIKGVGDRIDGFAIISIEFDGVRLQNGQRLTVDPAGQL
jgi:hypothetical protein